MNTHELESLFGIDVAIKKLRPNATFGLGGNQIIDWNDPTGSRPPTWEEIQQQIKNDAQALEYYHQKAENFVTLHEPGITPEETSQSKIRMKICQSCDKLMSGWNICKECSCFMPLKTRLADSKCPLDKW